MCTAISLKTKDAYFGRNLDLDVSYGEEVVVMPRNYKLNFKFAGELSRHCAIIGMATVISGIPLFYDGANEHGIAMAGLNFPNNAHYFKKVSGKDNICPFEIIPWILAKCKTLEEAKRLLERINLTNEPFCDTVPNSPLHFIVSDGESSLTVESTEDGLHIYDNPMGILTNNPPFPEHIKNLKNYEHLRNYNTGSVSTRDFCVGLGALGLPGDTSSPSRFVRAAFNKANSVSDGTDGASVSQLFHLLASVEFPRGSTLTSSGKYDMTVYSSCINLTRGRYYYKTYDALAVSSVDMQTTDLDGFKIARQKI